ncbi:MAG: DUF1343 domain-containing protein [Muribaculum sp.]|nr:DUF1343 domain-containing protein [Muribaculaceae bacterium]MCM1080460.1 DUF1343 domain-containing protein [Muribaculum sp.]
MKLKIHIIIAFLLSALPYAGAEVTVGAARPQAYMPLLKAKRIALLSNHTGMVDSTTHTLDALRANGLNIITILSPEHGFRGTADAGEGVDGGKDPATGIQVVSLYTPGRPSPLTPQFMSKFDVIVVDMQDVGARFYTYYITMLQVMEAAARTGVQVVVFDRPNPLGMVVDGPVLDMSLRSGVGRIPVPVLHGLTMGEIALMSNSEGWLADSLKCDLQVVTCQGYTHATRYRLPVAPSPNLPDMTSIYLYPSLCYFEGTTASLGRGTTFPFKVYGHPAMKKRGFSFTPRSMAGAKNPPQLGKLCHGVDLRSIPDADAIAGGVNLEYIIDAYNAMTTGKDKFFTSFFDKLIGNRQVRRMIVNGNTASQIRRSWQPELRKYRELRKNYLLYPES